MSYNVILIQIDSLNRHFLNSYGNDWVESPTLSAFAQKAAVFDKHFVGSLPCMPARREIWTGTQEFWWRSWGPLEPWDETIAFHAKQRDIVTQYITDHYHMFEWGSHSYHYDFQGYEFIRGHEIDNWKTDPVRHIPAWAEKMVAVRGEWGLRYLRNVQDFTTEADFFAPKVMQAAANWLDNNHAQPQFFLHIDSFDVHEPFHVPEPYRSMYTDADPARFNPWPVYGSTDAADSDEVAWVKAQFAGKLTMVDRWLAMLFDRIEHYDLYDNTCIIVTTDHGHYLGEHGWIGKPAAPMYHTLCHIPMLIWHPQGVHNGGRVNTFTQTHDLYATICDMLGVTIDIKPYQHSQSFAPLLTGETYKHRDYAVYGYANSRVGLTCGDWTLLREHDASAAPAYSYTNQYEQLLARRLHHVKERELHFPDLESGLFIPGLDTSVWRLPEARGKHEDNFTGEGKPFDLLFHNHEDPDQQQNHADTDPNKLNELVNVLAQYAQTLEVPLEQMQRLHLP